jgi:hypothetical protein
MDVKSVRTLLVLILVMVAVLAQVYYGFYAHATVAP